MAEDFQATLNRLAGTVGLDAQAAANVGAGTTGLDLVGALNAWAGTSRLELNGACKALAAQVGGNPSLDGPGALTGAVGSLLADAVWRVSATESPDARDLAGGGNDGVFTPVEDAANMGAIYVDPAIDGTAVAVRIDTSTFPDWGIRTPDSAALSITGDLMLRFEGRGLGDVSLVGENRYVFIGKSRDSADDDPDYPNYELSILLEDGRLNFIWQDSDEVDHSVSTPGARDWLERQKLLVRFQADDGDDQHHVWFYERDDNADDFVLAHDGSGWRLLGEVVGEGATDIRDTDGALRVAAFRATCSSGGVYDDISSDAEPVAWFDPADAGGFLIDDTFESVLTGETWTVPSFSAAIVPVDRPGWVCGIPQEDESGSRIVFADDPLLDFGTADGSVAVRVRTSVVGQAFAVYLQKFTGTLGVDGVGFALAEVDSIGGYAGVVQSGSFDFAAATATVGEHVLALTVDRGGARLRVYVDGVLAGTAQDITDTGSLSQAAALIIGGVAGPLSIAHAAGKWNRVLSAEEHAELVEVLV